MESKKNSGDSGDLFYWIKILWDKKYWIISGILIFTLFSIFGTSLLPKIYSGNGFLVTSRNLQDYLLLDKKGTNNRMYYGLNLSIPDYKRFSKIFTNNKKFISFISKQKANQNPELEKLLNHLTKNNINLAESIEPIYSFSRKDRLELAQINRDIDNFVIGIKIQLELKDLELCKMMITAIGNFIRDSIIYERLHDFIFLKYSQVYKDKRAKENSLLDHKFDLTLLKKKREQLLVLKKKYPGTKGVIPKEFISVDRGGFRYLSPTSQLIGVESTIIDINKEMGVLKREIKHTQIKMDFFSPLYQLLKNDLTGNHILQKIKSYHQKIFTPEKSKDEDYKRVNNFIKMDIEKYENYYTNGMGFSQNPQIIQGPVKPNRSIIVIFAFMMSIFIFIFLILIIHWWKINISKSKDQK